MRDHTPSGDREERGGYWVRPRGDEEPPLINFSTIKEYIDLVLILVLTTATVIAVGLEAPVPVRAIFGIPFILFCPGYTLIAALFPRKEDIGGIERAALSFGLSIAVVPLVGLILNYTPWGIYAAPVLFAITLFIVVTLVTTFYRRQKLPKTQRFSVHITMPSLGWKDTGWLDRSMTIILGVAIVAALGALIYVIAVVPKEGEKFTEFYVLGIGEQASDYPEELAVDEEGRVILGLANHEYQEVTYYIRARIDGESLPIHLGEEQVDQLAITLAHDEEWEQEIAFVPELASEQEQKLEFFLWSTIHQPEETRDVSIDIPDAIAEEADEDTTEEEGPHTSIDLQLGQTGSITIVNNGEAEASYTVKVTEGGEESLTDLLDIDQGGEASLSFEVTSLEDAEVLVYKDDTLIFTDDGAYLSLHLWLTVE
jgi:uncharacterized membrane protein